MSPTKKVHFLTCLLILLLISVSLQGANIIIRTGLDATQIYIDNRLVATTDASGSAVIANVKSGSYTVEARKAGYSFQTQKVVVKGEIDALVRFSATRQAGQSAQPGQKTPNILIDGNLAEVSVFVDGQPAGKTGPDGKLALAIPQGQRRISFARDGFQGPQPLLVEVRDTLQRVTFRMQSLPGSKAAGPALPGAAAKTPWLLILLILVLLGVLGLAAYVLSLNRSQAVFHSRYQIKGIIGRGGMATVYKARDKKTGNLVALKIMDASLMSDADLLRKFLREGDVLMMLNKKHPQAPLVRVFEYGRENGRTQGKPFIAMEFLKGRDLMAHLRENGVLTLYDARKIVLKVLEALEAAHQSGVYHRDLTPDNIIITNEAGENIVKLIDFGVARHEYTSAGTLDGSITGKPPYMSPEQCRGQSVDGRSDIYSLGIVFYTILTGHPPFVSTNPLEVMKKHETADVPLLPDSVPERIAVVIYKMLEKNPQNRYRDTRQLIDTLHGVAV